MRLLIQGCLILGLCFLTSVAKAELYSDTQAEAYNACQSYISGHQWADQCDGPVYYNHEYDSYVARYSTTGAGYSSFHYPRATGSCDGEILHDADSGQYDCSTEPPPCTAPNFIDPDTGDCRPPQEPEECYENGQIYDAEYGRCVLDCPNGQLNGICLQDTGENADDCNADSPDYKGFIGNGATKHNLCTSNMECEGGAFGLVNGTPACIPDEYGPPTCPADGALVIDEYGFVCESVNDAPEEPDTPEEPNTDTDGDGQPDEYQRENDPTSVDKGLDKVQDGISDTNTNWTAPTTAWTSSARASTPSTTT